MAKPSLTITHASIGGAKTISCKNVTVGFSRSVVTTPYANPGTPAKAQTQGQENMTYACTGVTFTGASGELTYAQLLTLAKINYDGTNAPTLTLVYGKTGSTSTLVAYDGATTNIPVVIKTFTGSFDTEESIGGYRPKFTINLIETG